MQTGGQYTPEDMPILKFAVKIEEEPLDDLPLRANEHGPNKNGLMFGSELENVALKIKIEPMETGSCGSDLDNGSYKELTQTRHHECEICAKIFVNRFDFIKHNLEHLRVKLPGPKIQHCVICQKIFAHKKQLTIHSLKHRKKDSNDGNKERISDQLHECELCNKTFKYRHWHEHMMTVHIDSSSDIQWKCSICFKIFKCKRYLVRHKLHIHEQHKPRWMERREENELILDNIKCNLCPKWFRNRDCLGQHIKNVHKDEGKTFSCPICGSVLKSNVYLRAHMRRVHPDSVNVFCKICGKRFKSLRYLRVHQKNTHFKREVTKEKVVKLKTNAICQKKVNGMKNTEFGKFVTKENYFEEGEVMEDTDSETRVTKENDSKLHVMKNANFRKGDKRDNECGDFDVITSNLGMNDNKVRIIDWKDM